MPTVRIKVQPTGLINGMPWPAVGETMQLDNEAAARGMAEAGVLEVVDDAKDPEPPKDPAKREEPEKAVSRSRPQRRRRAQRSE